MGRGWWVLVLATRGRFRFGGAPPGFWHGLCPLQALYPVFFFANPVPDRPLQEAYRVYPCKPRALLLVRNVQNANPVPTFSLQNTYRTATFSLASGCTLSKGSRGPWPGNLQTRPKPKETHSWGRPQTGPTSTKAGSLRAKRKVQATLL